MKCENCGSNKFYLSKNRIVFIYFENGQIDYECSPEEFSSEIKCRNCDNIIADNLTTGEISNLIYANDLSVLN